MSRIFLSHSSKDWRQAVALKQWLVEQEPALANEIFLDVDLQTGIPTGTRWKDALRRASARCEAVVCLLSPNWERSDECRVEYRTAENLNKQIFCARLDPASGEQWTAEWQRCDLFGDADTTEVVIDSGPAVVFATEGLYRLRDGLRGAGIGAETFTWPPPQQQDRLPYGGWEPFEPIDAGVFFGRDAPILRALDSIRGLRKAQSRALFVILGPSGSGKSSFLRAGLVPRLLRDDREYVVLDAVRPERNAITGDSGLARAIHATRQRLDLTSPTLGEIKAACASDPDQVRELLTELQHTALARHHDADVDDDTAPTIVLPLDQAEELISTDAGPEAQALLELIGTLAADSGDDTTGFLVVATIRTDRYETLQTRTELTDVTTELFGELRPMPTAQFKEVITGPAARATEAGHRLTLAPDLVEQLLDDCAEGADTLPLLSLTLAGLYQDFGSSGELTLAQYNSTGGLSRVVQTVIDGVLSREPSRRRAELAVLREAFIPWLATVNPDNDQPMRRVANYDDLPEDSRQLIDALVGKRLMIKDTRAGAVVVEVALESLLRQWDELAEWLRQERSNLLAADALERTTQAWRSNQQDPAWLLAGSRLTEAESLSSRTGFRRRLEGSRAFLNASRDAEDQRQLEEQQRREAELLAARERQLTAERHSASLRRLLRVTAAVAVVALIGLVAAIVGFVQADNAREQAQTRFREATGLRLDSDAQHILSDSGAGGDVLALQQILAADRLAETVDVGSLYSAVTATADTVKIAETTGISRLAHLTPDGRLLATAAPSDTVVVWDTDAGVPVGQPLPVAQSSLTGIAISADGRRVATGAGNGDVTMWDLDSGKAIGAPLSGHRDDVLSLAFSPDGRRLATGGADTDVRVFDTETGQQIGPTMTDHVNVVLSLAFSPDGRRLASGSASGNIRLWDLLTGKQIGAPLTGHDYGVLCLAFSPDGRRLVSGSRDKTALVWNADTGQPIGAPLSGHQNVVLAVAFSPDGRRVLTGSADNTARLWDSGTGLPLGQPLAGHTDSVYGVAFDPDGRTVVSASVDDTARRWDLDVAHVLVSRPDIVGTGALSPDGHLLAGGSQDGTVRLWDTGTGQQVAGPLTSGAGEVYAVAVSSDGRRVASASLTGEVRLWDVGTGRPIALRYSPADGVGIYAVAFDPDGTLLATGAANGEVRLWDTTTGAQVGETFTHRPLSGNYSEIDELYALAFSPDGRRLATAGVSDGSVLLWDVDTQQRIGAPLLGHTDSVYAVAFSPDGTRLATGGADTEVRLWDTATGQQLGGPLKGHVKAVYAVDFSPDGTRLATGSELGQIRLWDTETHAQIGMPLIGETPTVWSVAFSSDGARLVSSGLHGSAQTWPAVADPEMLCAKLTHNMSHRQWREWVSADIGYIQTCPDLAVAGDEF